MKHQTLEEKLSDIANILIKQQHINMTMQREIVSLTNELTILKADRSHMTLPVASGDFPWTETRADQEMTAIKTALADQEDLRQEFCVLKSTYLSDQQELRCELTALKNSLAQQEAALSEITAARRESGHPVKKEIAALKTALAEGNAQLIALADKQSKAETLAQFHVQQIENRLRFLQQQRAVPVTPPAENQNKSEDPPHNNNNASSIRIAPVRKENQDNNNAGKLGSVAEKLCRALGI